uniref:3-hydroxyisobutyrate dehydrogenase n=1 Tax=Blastobotrys adeninivorans TaxID=409370 RepID=A0A060TEJ0_BLAAD
MIAFRRGFSTSFGARKSYGFIGLGRMGVNMAQNLRAKLPESEKVVVYDVNPKAMKEITGPNVVMAGSVSEVAAEADTVLTMLPEGKHVRQVYGEIAETCPGGQDKLFIDSTTHQVKTSLETAALLKEKNIGSYVDAPVSGGVVGAKKGTLTFMIGAKDLSRVSPVLSLMGARLVSCGGPGSGLAAKLANNYLLALNNIATAEAFQLAKNLGLDMKMFSDLINTSTGRCWSSEVNTPCPGVNPDAPSSRGYEGGFGVPLMTKDLKLAIDAANECKSQLVMAKNACDVYDAVLRDKEYADKDMSVIYKWLEQ